MLPFRLLIAVSLGLTIQAPLFAQSAVDGASSAIAAPHAAAIAASEIKPPSGDRTYPSFIPLNWSLAPGRARQTNAQGADDSAIEAFDQDETIGSQDPDQDVQSKGEDDNPEGEIIVDGSYGPPDSDPAEALNFESYRITQAVDDAFVEPVAYAYRDGLPGPFRDGLGNVVRNLGEPVNALNFLLQGKFGKALGSLTRLLINSTLGLGGVFDLAEKPGIGIPYRRNGFANTMGFYGVEPGAYLYLPFTGATSVRDVIGSGLDQLVLPVAVGAPFNTPKYTVPYFIVNSLDARLEVDEELARIDATVDPYAARRDTYLARREREIALLRGEEPPKPPLILLEVEGVIEPGDDYPEDMQDGEAGEEAPPLSLNLERGEVIAGQIR